MTMLSKPPAPPSIVPGTLPPAAMTKVSLLFAAPVRFVKPLNPSPPTDPPPLAFTFHVVSADGPTIVWAPPLAITLATLENEMVTGPLTLPEVPFTVQVAPAPVTSSEPPAPAYVTGAPTLPPVVSTTSELPADPVMLMSVTVFVGRVLVVPPDDTERPPPDEPTVIEPPDGAEAVHVSRNVIDDGSVVRVVVAPPASVSSVDAAMVTAPYTDFVT